jgi:hypothetical protein
VPNIEAPEDDTPLMPDPRVIDDKLRRHVKSLRRWDVLFGHLALLSQTMRCWWTAGFASFEHYCVERLGMSLRTVEQRIALEGHNGRIRVTGKAPDQLVWMVNGALPEIEGR